MEHIRYEVDGPIGVITLDRTEKANAVDQQALDELNAAFEAAAADREVRVIVLRAEGKHFCSGHDLTASNAAVGREAGEATPRPGVDWDVRGLQAIYEWETIHYLGYSRRWRDIPKPTVAMVFCTTWARSRTWIGKRRPRTPTLSIGSSRVSRVLCASCSGVIASVVIECSLGITANIAGASRLAKRRKLLALGQARLHEGSPQRVALGVEV